MVINTTRFGEIEIDGDRLISFPRGILGFPQHKNFVLIQTEAESSFYWLQSVEAADLAFVVTDPLVFLPDYSVPIREETRLEIGLDDITKAQVLVIVNKVGDTLTANLQGPLVIHAESRQATQIVISEKKYQTRHPIVQLNRSGNQKTSGQYISKSA